MLKTNILNQMDTDELRNYIYKQDVAMDYYKETMRTYGSELHLLESFIDIRSQRFKQILSLNAANAVITDIEYELNQKYGERPVYKEGEE